MFTNFLKKTDSALLNREILLDRVGGDEDLLREIANIFLEEYPVLINDIEDAVKGSNPAALEHAAHSLKGSVSNFGAEAATSAAFALEQMGRQRQLQDTSRALDNLKNELERLRPALLTIA